MEDNSKHIKELISQGIFVRKPFATPGDRCIRVSCGPDQDLALFRAALPEALKAAGAPPDAYLYFDVGAWERRIFPQSTAGLAAGFLPEEEAEVKFS